MKFSRAFDTCADKLKRRVLLDLEEISRFEMRVALGLSRVDACRVDRGLDEAWNIGVTL
jgi:hypothetical protein